jgi:hypothetical protein
LAAELISVSLGMQQFELLSIRTLEHVLILSMISAVVVIPLIARRRRPEAPYFSGTFALALWPFISVAFVTFFRIHSLLDHEDLSPHYVIRRMHFPLQIMIFGGAASAFSIIIHSSIYALRRKHRKA